MAVLAEVKNNNSKLRLKNVNFTSILAQRLRATAWNRLSSSPGPHQPLSRPAAEETASTPGVHHRTAVFEFGIAVGRSSMGGRRIQAGNRRVWLVIKTSRTRQQVWIFALAVRGRLQTMCALRQEYFSECIWCGPDPTGKKRLGSGATGTSRLLLAHFGRFVGSGGGERCFWGCPR